MGGNKNSFTRFLLSCANCCLACIERTIKILTRNAYIYMAIEGKSFITSASAALSLIMSNPALVSTLAGIGGVFRFLGKVFISLITVYICFYILDTYEPWKTTVNSVFLPLVVIFIISWIIGVIFMSVYGMAIDTVLICFLKSR